MKNSYYKTPRSLDESTFHSWGNAIVHDDEGKDPDAIVVIVSALAIAAILVMAVLGWLN